MRATRYLVIFAILGLVFVQMASAQPVELLQALATGQVGGVFYGDGDSSVRGRLQRSPSGPDQLYVQPGTQFWAQVPGLQGMTTIGYTPIDMTGTAYAYVNIPTACTNYGLPAPTRMTMMSPVPCPDVRMARLTAVTANTRPERIVSQVAVWAVANNPTWQEIIPAVASRLPQQENEAQMASAVEFVRQQAAQLVTAAGLSPADFRMFGQPGPPQS